MGCGMSKTLEAKMEKAGEQIAGSVVDAAVDLTVSVVKDASALGQEVVKEAIADAKEIVERCVASRMGAASADSENKMAELRRSMDSAAAVVDATDKALETVVEEKSSEPVAPEPVEEKK